MDDKSTLLEQVRACEFVMIDLNLYLDTHPSDENALKDFKLCSEMFMRLKKQYESKFGPLTIDNAATDTCWLWINNPWPWDNMMEV